MIRSNPIIKGTLILTASGLLTRLIGFFYRIFLSNLIGAEQLGIYQMIFPLLMLLFSLTASGSQHVISRQIAASEDAGEQRRILYAGLFLSLALSLPTAWVLHTYAAFLAAQFLSEPRCAPLLQAAAWSVPLAAVHMCVEGYYHGRRKTGVPALTGLAEQVVRVLAVWVLYRIAVQEGRPVTVSIAVWGLVLGEAASALICLTALSLQGRAARSPLSLAGIKTIYSPFLHQGIPQTANRVLLSLLQSAEAAFLPSCLQLHGLSAAESLSIYGVLTGMAMPFIMFPSTFTSSASAMLMPTVAKAQACKNVSTLKHTASATLKYTLLLGIFCTGVFVTFGQALGSTLFQNTLAGTFLQILGWICPLIYLSTTFASILHGLGRTTLVFVVNLIGMLLRLLFVLFFVPVTGIYGYLVAMLLCHLLSAILFWAILYRILHVSFDAVTTILKPSFCALAGCLGARFLYTACLPAGYIGLAAAIAVSGSVYLFFLVQLGCFPRRSRISG